MGPDRVAMIADYVRQGGSLIMAGGWVDFQGFQAKGNYHGSAIEEILPVGILPVDDRVETTQGAAVKVLDSDHPVLRGSPRAGRSFSVIRRSCPRRARRSWPPSAAQIPSSWSGRSGGDARWPSQVTLHRTGEPSS